MNRRHLLRRGGALLLATGISRPALAQAWPSRNITLVVPFPPGGSNDVFARAIADKLAAALGVAVIIDNRGGAGGTIGSSAVARMPPDGYTLMIGHIGTLGLNPSLYPNLSYDTLTSFDYVAPLGLVPNILVVHPSLPAKTVQELIDYAHANPGKLNYSTAGSGSAADIAMAAFNLAAKTRMVPVPYRGTAPALTDLLAGQVQLTMTGSTAVLQHVHAGTMRGRRLHAQTAERRTRNSRHRGDAAGLRGLAMVWHRRACPHPGTDPRALLRRDPQNHETARRERATCGRRGRSLGGDAGAIPQPCRRGDSALEGGRRGGEDQRAAVRLTKLFRGRASRLGDLRRTLIIRPDKPSRAACGNFAAARELNRRISPQADGRRGGPCSSTHTCCPPPR
jgi:tripartite-type tricarboxylate transporter receptor subunit TctC